MPRVNWVDRPYHRLSIAWAWGEAGDLNYIAAPYKSQKSLLGEYDVRELARLRATLAQRNVVVVGHNVMKYDMSLLQGVLVDHGLEPFKLPIRCVDTMSEYKWGGAFRNTLKARCEAYGITLKGDSPDWDKIMAGDAREWALMEEYNRNDVDCALELREALVAHGIDVSPREWKPRGR